MGDWEDEEDDFGGGEAPPAPTGNDDPFGDEDQDEDVADDWDVDSDEEREKEAAAKAAASAPKPAKKLTKLELAIEKREQEQAVRRRARAAAGVVDEEEEEDVDTLDEDPMLRKARLERKMKMADLQNAEDLFGVGEVDLDDPASPAGGGRAVMPKMAREGPTLDQLDPDTEEDFDLYLSELERKLDFGSGSEFFLPFMKKLMTNTCGMLKEFEVKELMTTLTTVQNDIIKSNKVVGKKGKAKAAAKKSPAASRKPVSTQKFVADEYDDYDDIADSFM